MQADRLQVPSLATGANFVAKVKVLKEEVRRILRDSRSPLYQYFSDTKCLIFLSYLRTKCKLFQVFGKVSVFTKKKDDAMKTPLRKRRSRTVCQHKLISRRKLFRI